MAGKVVLMGLSPAAEGRKRLGWRLMNFQTNILLIHCPNPATLIRKPEMGCLFVLQGRF